MKKIGLISDTHGYFDPKIIPYFSDRDEIWHAGDIGSRSVIAALEKIAIVKAVYGNIDDHKIREEFPLDAVFYCEEVKVWMTHIGGYPGHYDKRISQNINQLKSIDLFISGHSHILKVMRDAKYHLLHMNPGAAGYSGFHKVKTILRFEIDQHKISSLEVIELGIRGL